MTNPKHQSIRIAVSLFAALTSGHALAQDGTAITSGQADAILKELRAIREIISRVVPGATQPAAVGNPLNPTKVKLNLDGLPALGSKEAPVTIAEFSDYQ